MPELVTKQALLDEIALEKEFLNQKNYLKPTSKLTQKQIDVHRAFIGGLERASEMCDQPEFQPEPSYEELQARIKFVYKILAKIMDLEEAVDPENYYHSQFVAQCNDWFKWADNEMDAEDKEKYFNYPPKK